MTIARHLRITGLVQGVFFRAWTREQAEQLDIRGWVRNCPDGAVEAHLEGDKSAVEQLIDSMRQGPPNARVDHLQVGEAAAENFGRFEVRR
jgi:acylphosphatase